MKKQAFWHLKRHFDLLSAVGMLVFYLSFIFSGCATAKKETTGKKEPYEKIPFSEILKSPEGYKGKVVRLGGVILNTEIHEEETVLEILEKPLSWRGRPKPSDDSGGRFMVVFDRFLDKAIYRPNRPVTIVGEIMGTETALIGEKVYEYPLLSGREIRLWEERGYYNWPRIHIGIGISGGSGGSRGTVGVGTSF